MKRKIQDLIQHNIYGDSVTRFEDRLLLLSLLIISVLHFISAILNVLMGLKNLIVLTSVFGAIIFLILFFLFRFVSRSISVYFITGILSLLFIDFVWFVNYGSNGPVMIFLLVYYALMILLFGKKYYPAISLIFLVNLIGLYLFELYDPGKISNYPNRLEALNDNYLGLILGVFTIFLFISVIKANYLKEYKHARDSDMLKSAFLANMSHEIRTPLNAIVGFSSLISDKKIADEDKKVFEVQIQENSDYLLKLIEDIIDVSKIEANQMSIVPHKIDIVPLMNRLIKSFLISMPKEKNIRLTNDFAFESLLMTVDEVRLEQILRNLISNAIKFTDDGEIVIACRSNYKFVTISISDTGIGIRGEDLQIIFDRFRKIENQRQHLFRGTGLGLFLSKQLVELMDGTIWVESELGKGSTFYFTLPA